MINIYEICRPQEFYSYVNTHTYTCTPNVFKTTEKNISLKEIPRNHTHQHTNSYLHKIQLFIEAPASFVMILTKRKIDEIRKNL